MMQRLLGASVSLLTSCASYHSIPPDVSARPSIHTADVKRGTFVVFGDTQQAPVMEWFARGGPRERRRVADRVREIRADVVFLAGDLVGAGWVKGYWREFRREYQGLPLYPVLGNHDLMGPDRRALTHYFESFPHLERRRWYEVRYGPIAFLMLDSNPGQMARRDWETQLQWLTDRLDAAEADPSVRCVALVTHHPMLSVSWPGAGRRLYRAIYLLAARYGKFRMTFSGHHHAFQHLRDGGRHLFVTGGGGAPQFLTTSNPLPAGAELVRARKVHHVVVGRIVGDRVRIELQELTPEGEWIITKVTEVDLQGGV